MRCHMEEHALAVHAMDLVKGYGPVTAVDHVTLKVAVGEIFGLLGPNGAGKTTTLEILEGLRRPDHGDVRILGYPGGNHSMAVRERIGILLQGSQLMDTLTPRELTTLYASFYRRPRDPQALLHEMGLVEKADTYVRQLSGGQKQRLALALALVGDPEEVA